MSTNITCKSCGSTITVSDESCPVCHIKSPRKMSDKKKYTLYTSLAVFVILIIVIPMVAALLWMQTK